MKFSQESIDKMKQWYRDFDGTELSDYEADEAWNNLCEYFKILYEWDQEEKRKALDQLSGASDSGSGKAC